MASHYCNIAATTPSNFPCFASPRYLGVVAEDGDALLGDEEPKMRSTVKFLWTVDVFTAVYMEETQLELRDAKRRGVPIPEGWQAKISATGFSHLASDAAVRAARAYPGLSVSCNALGAPRGLSVPSKHGGLRVGSVVAMPSEGGMPQAHLLCAHVYGNQWLCHPEPLPSGVGEAATIHIANVAMTDIRTHANMDGKFGNKDAHDVAGSSALQAAVERRAPAIAKVVALAAWRAEEIRAIEERRLVDVRVASNAFDLDAFKWTSEGGRIDSTKVFAMWSWQASVQRDGLDAAACEERRVVEMRLENVWKRGVPMPPALLDLWLLGALEESARTVSAPCRYLGVSLNPACDWRGPFEPEPAKWPERAYHASGKMRATVWFEWLHVQRESNGERIPHRVSARVDAVVGKPARETISPLTAPPGSFGRRSELQSMPFDNLADLKDPVFSFNFNGQVLHMVPKCVLGMLRSMTYEDGYYVPFPGKYQLVDQIKGDICEMLERYTAPTQHRVTLENMRVELTNIQGERSVDSVLSFAKAIHASRCEVRADRADVLARALFNDLAAHGEDLRTARRFLKTELTALASSPNVDVDGTRSQAIVSVDRDLADILGDEDTDMEALCAAAGAMSVAPPDVSVRSPARKRPVNM